jgi:hypothetical protein
MKGKGRAGRDEEREGETKTETKRGGEKEREKELKKARDMKSIYSKTESIIICNLLIYFKAFIH